MLNIWHDIIGNTTNLIAAISSIATFITARIAYLAIKETQWQRESSYRPDLYLETSSARLISPDFANSFAGVRYMQEKRTAPTDSHIVPPDENLTYDRERFLTPQSWLVGHFFNIGLGTAKAVEYKWEFDIESCIDQLERMSATSSLRVSKNNGVDPDSKIRYSIDFNFKNYTLYFFGFELDRKNATDFIRTNSPPVVHSQVTISGYYLDILTTYLFLKYRLLKEQTDNHINELFEELPSLYLILAYSDVQNKRYNKKIKVAFTYYSSPTKFNPRFALFEIQHQDFGTLFTRVSEINY